MPPRDIDELRIVPGGPDRDHVAEREKRGACDPQLQTQSDCARQCRIGDSKSARRTAEQDMLGQGPVAKIVAVIIIIATGLALAFGDTSGGFRRLIQIVFGLSIAFAASSFFLSFFSFGGGALV